VWQKSVIAAAFPCSYGESKETFMPYDLMIIGGLVLFFWWQTRAS
jgi:hypothetical protein